MIPPGKEITIAAADHWRYTIPRQTMLRIATHLEHAKGCIIDKRLYRALTDSMAAQITAYKIAADITQDLPEQINEIIETRKVLTRKQRTAQWFRDKAKDLVAWLLGILAAAEGAYIIYLTVTR